MSLSIKLGVSALALGSAFGVGYGAVNYFSKENKEDSINKPQTKSVSDLIKEKYQYILLDFSEQGNNPDKEYWAKIWADYEKENKTGSDALNLEGWAERGTANFTDKIKEKCTGLSSSMIINEEEKPYKDVTKYCSRPVTLKDEAAKDGLEVIPSKDGTLDNTKWQQKLNQKTQLQEHFNKLELTDSALTPTKVREKCNQIQSKEKQATDYQDKLPAYKAVCANPKGG